MWTIKNFKDTFKFMIISILIWGFGYLLMYVTKWVIASIVLGKDYIVESLNKAKIRINGEVEYLNGSNIWIQDLRRNFNNINPIFYIRKKYIIYVLVPTITIIMLLINKYRNKDNSYLYVILLLGLIPYIRYVMMSNHSYYHFFFTFRIQLVTIIAFVLIILNNFKKSHKKNKKLE